MKVALLSQIGIQGNEKWCTDELSELACRHFSLTPDSHSSENLPHSLVSMSKSNGLFCESPIVFTKDPTIFLRWRPFGPLYPQKIKCT